MKQKMRIIIVDNDPDELEYMQEGFSETGHFEVIATAGDAEGLIAMLEMNGQQMPDLIITDLNMPGKTGLDLFRELSDAVRTAAIPVVISSTVQLPDSVVKAPENSAVIFMVKPEMLTQYAAFAEEVHSRAAKWLNDRIVS